jgi:hypothetical protein
MAFPNEAKFSMPEEEPKLIAEEVNFRRAFKDAKGQFIGMIMDQNKTVPRPYTLAELQERNREIDQKTPYLPFEEYIRKERGQTMSTKIAEDFRLMTIMYDHLITRIKNFQSREELEDIIEDVKTYIKEDF